MMEDLSILLPRTSGFVKIAAYAIATSKCELDEQLNSFRSIFVDYEIEKETVRKHFSKMIENVRKVGKRNLDMKKYILKTFSTSSWKKLSVSEKARHTFKNCEMCLEKFQTLMDAFPINKNARLHSKQKAVDMSELQNKTMEIYEKANCELKNNFLV